MKILEFIDKMEDKQIKTELFIKWYEETNPVNKTFKLSTLFKSFLRTIAYKNEFNQDWFKEELIIYAAKKKNTIKWTEAPKVVLYLKIISSALPTTYAARNMATAVRD